MAVQLRSIHTIVHHYLLVSHAWEDGFIVRGELDGMALVSEVRRWHKGRGWLDVGYHCIIDTMGGRWPGRPLEQIGAGVAGRNTGKVHIAYVGGVDEFGVKGADTRTPEQRDAMYQVTRDIEAKLGRRVRVVGHNDLAATHCPGYSVRLDYNDWLLEKKFKR